MALAFEDSADVQRDDGRVWIPGRTFTMGSDRHYPEEAPAHPVKVDGFWISDTPVTNRQFKAFVEATGHVIIAEKVPDPKDYPGAKPEMLRARSLVFTRPKSIDGPGISQWWTFKLDATWRRPLGGISDLRGKLDTPLSTSHMQTRTLTRRGPGWLRTQAEWELATRVGSDAEYAWGDELTPGGIAMVNTCSGTFPTQSNKTKGQERTPPVRSYPPNGHGLYDMIGNVWEWTMD